MAAARALFDHFVMGRLELEAPNVADSLRSSLSLETAVPNDLQDAATTLLRIASAFANSPQRQQVRDLVMAQSLNISADDLNRLLQSILDPARREELQERIVVAFFFCYDFLKRLLALGLEKLRQFWRMCTASITRVLDPIVSAAGGWNNVMATAAAGGIFFTGTAIVIGVALLIGKALTGW